MPVSEGEEPNAEAEERFARELNAYFSTNWNEEEELQHIQTELTRNDEKLDINFLHLTESLPNEVALKHKMILDSKKRIVQSFTPEQRLLAK